MFEMAFPLRMKPPRVRLASASGSSLRPQSFRFSTEFKQAPSHYNSDFRSYLNGFIGEPEDNSWLDTPIFSTFGHGKASGQIDSSCHICHIVRSIDWRLNKQPSEGSGV